MSKEILKDQLSWSEFYKHSKNLKTIKKIKPFNRLIAHSKNFYIIAGYGAFTPGYLLVLSKEFIPSFGLMNEDSIDELNFMIKISKKFIKNKYNRDSVIFEHGMCACIGGLDRAHLHIMSIHEASNSETVKVSIDRTLYNRKAGIKYIVFNNYKLENIHDINQIIAKAKTAVVVKKRPTAAVAVNVNNYVIPRLRGVNIETDYIVKEQRTALIASQALGFEELVAGFAGNRPSVKLIYQA